MELTLIITNKNGLTSRLAAQLSQTAMKFKSTVSIMKGDKELNAKQLINVVMLGVKQDESIVLKIHGSDVDEAAKALKQLVDSKFA